MTFNVDRGVSYQRTVSAKLREAIAALDAAADREDSAWAKFNAAKDAANAELANGPGGEVISWAGERAARWVPSGRDWTVAPEDTFLIGGVAIDGARANPPAAVAKICKRHRLPVLMDDCARASKTYYEALAALVQTPVTCDRERLEQAAALLAHEPGNCGHEDGLRDAADVVVAAAARDFGCLTASFGTPNGAEAVQ